MGASGCWAATIHYGTTTNYAHCISDAGGTRKHNILLQHLIPGQTYHYQASSTDGFSLKNAFRTAPTSTGSVNFVVYGDSQRGSSPQDPHRDVVANMMTKQTDFIVGVGDLADESGHPQDWDIWAEYLDVVSDLFAEVIYLPTSGNHENPNDKLAYYWSIFDLPQKPANGRYYSLDYSVLPSPSLYSVKPWSKHVHSDQLVPHLHSIRSRYATRMDVVFNNGTDWDNNDLIEWHVPISKPDGYPPYLPLPLVSEGSPIITPNPVSQNNIGDNFDI